MKVGINQWKPQIFKMISITVCDKHLKPHTLMLLQTDKLSQVTLMALGTNQTQFITTQWPSSSSCSTTLLLSHKGIPLKSGSRRTDSKYYLLQSFSLFLNLGHVYHLYQSTVLITPFIFLYEAVRNMRFTGMSKKKKSWKDNRERWLKGVVSEQEMFLKNFNAVSHTQYVAEVYFLNYN